MADRGEWLRELGLAPTWRLRDTAADRGTSGGRATVPASSTAADTSSAPAPVALLTPADRRAHIATLDWSAFAADVDGCTACGLCRTRNRAVPGVGDRRAEWLFVGEAPGAEEDAKGEPFVGQAGRLLDNMLAALGMSRGANVYIANVLKCRPPNNRAPEPLEAEACRPYLERQIALLQTTDPIGKLRGRVHRYQGVPVVVTYHPAYLLRNLPDKAKAWADLCLARQLMRDQP